MYLPPVLVPKRDIMTPRIPRIYIFVTVIHVWYTQNIYLLLFSQFRIYLGFILMQNRECGVFTPVLAPFLRQIVPKWGNVLRNYYQMIIVVRLYEMCSVGMITMCTVCICCLIKLKNLFGHFRGHPGMRDFTPRWCEILNIC